MSHKKPSKPAAWKNTYFWIAGLLLIIAVYGLASPGKDNTIRDPGQRREDGLIWFYFAASVLMVVNGMLSHRQTVKHYEETVGPLNSEGNAGSSLDRLQSEPNDQSDVETDEKRELNG